MFQGGVGAYQGGGMMSSRGRSRSPPPGKPKPGCDWYCPNCADLQFAQNATCRMCGTPRDLGVDKITLDMFLKNYEVEEGVVEELRALTPDLQKMIMDKGSLAKVRDPTAVIIKRMCSLQCPRKGDWYCPNCFDLVFSKNASCKRCNTPRELSAYDPDKPPQPPDARQFLLGHDVRDEIVQQFLEMEPEQQSSVIARGSLHGCKDANAVLISRMQSVRSNASGCGGKGKKGKGKKKGGDADWGGGGGVMTRAEGEQMMAMMGTMMSWMKGGGGGKGGWDDDGFSGGGFGSQGGGFGGGFGGRGPKPAGRYPAMMGGANAGVGKGGCPGFAPGGKGICQDYQLTGLCKWGDQCWQAH